MTQIPRGSVEEGRRYNGFSTLSMVTVYVLPTDHHSSMTDHTDEQTGSVSILKMGTLMDPKTFDPTIDPRCES